MDLDAVNAVFKRAGVTYGYCGQFAFLANQDEAFAQRISQRCSEDRTARLDASDLVYLYVLVALRQFIDRGAKAHRVFEQGGGAKLDALFRIVRSGADFGFDRHLISPLS